MKNVKLAEIAYAVLDNSDPKSPFYVVFHEDLNGGSYVTERSSIPQLFATLPHAMNMKTIAEKRRSPNERGGTFKIETLRLVPSGFDDAPGGTSSRLADARLICSGLLHYDAISKSVKKLAGKVLTILDAAYTNDTQNKAVKDLVKSSFRSQLGDIYTEAYRDPNSGEDGCEAKSETDILD